MPNFNFIIMFNMTSLLSFFKFYDGTVYLFKQFFSHLL